MMEDNDFLNKVDMGYIGLTKPKITLIKERSIEDRRPSKFEDSDNCADDPEQAWDTKE